MNQTCLRIMLPISLVFLFCCAAAQKQSEQKTATPELNRQEKKQNVSIAELKQLYKDAKSEYERRAVCLRAIDEGMIHQGGSVSSIDETFSTQFASELPTSKETILSHMILFAPQVSVPPNPDGRPMAISDVGWYMAFNYDHNGTIQDYHLSNIHKGGSRRFDGKEPVSITELKRLYEAAKSEKERRDVCLRAIDEGVIQTYGPVPISTIDEIFGTHFASDVPTRKESRRLVVVDLVPSTASPQSGGKAEAVGHTGWFLAVVYNYDGNIENYYLTNIHK
ncbi:MAG: hypothetical protein WBP93_05125 [Pyrinomonadaceae bacterium]